MIAVIAVTVFDRPAWYDQAACRGIEPRLFFPEAGDIVVARHARAVCAVCPSCPECLAYALEHEEHFGIWGGTTERERRRLRNALEATR